MKLLTRVTRIAIENEDKDNYFLKNVAECTTIGTDYFISLESPLVKMSNSKKGFLNSYLLIYDVEQVENAFETKNECEVKLISMCASEIKYFNKCFDLYSTDYDAYLDQKIPISLI